MKLRKRMFIGLVFVLGVSLYIYSNLKHNSVYYAQQMPHKEGTEPDLIMLIENMGWVYTPDIDGIRYDDDGMNTIAKKRGEDESIFSSSGQYLVFRSSSGEHYLFNHTLSIQDAFDKNYKTIKIDQQSVLKEIRGTLQPVLDAQRKPVINLQWLFNLLYQDRFK